MLIPSQRDLADTPLQADRLHPPKRQASHIDLPMPAPSRAAPPPIAFPDAEREERERKERQRVERIEAAFGERLRHSQALKAAEQSGLDRGYVVGYRAGTQWGLWCGAAGGVLLGMLIVVIGIKLGMVFA